MTIMTLRRSVLSNGLPFLAATASPVQGTGAPTGGFGGAVARGRLFAGTDLNGTSVV